jgi:hypothetical protein
LLSLHFPYLRAHSDPRPVPAVPGYVIGAMMTPSHARFGERLAASCHRHSLPLALFEVPTVHRSISPKGSDDLTYTKANFVHFLLTRYGRPVLYVDVDCVIAQPPIRIQEILAQQKDFAIFNWLAEMHTEAYVPADLSRWEAFARTARPGRFYRFSHSIDDSTDSQLLCSGAVQWYNTTSAAALLLENWQAAIERAPGTADDKCLDFAFNNFPRQTPLTPAWLDKRYARYAWWIYAEPVIDHPEMPFSGEGFVPLVELDGKPRIHREALRRQAVHHVFPKDCLIDTETRTLMRLRDGVWHAVGRFTMPLWL